ncbi:MAG: biotin carboxylase N-terminal domain-containing protein [Acutalibacteraceae bacterium]
MFSKILVANRGEIAIKIIEVCKEMKIKTVAVYSEADKDSLHVKVADESYCIGPANMQNSYLNMDAILTIAIATKAEAIHPGYGMLSENYEFAAKCEENNICFIGPRSDVLKMMCNKIEIKKFMKNCGVPVIPGTCIVNGINQVKLEAEKIGYPVVIKIQNGGGGRGIKIVYKKEDIEKAVNEALCEGEKFSTCDKIYIEKYLSPVKHIELQVIADKFRNIVILGERDCSIQVNNQKIIEEAPCYNLDPNLRNNLLKMCTNAIKQSDYFGLGTLEFLMDKDKNFYFMEMNCRIQVEYPITQLITGINIIKTQIEIAASQKIKFKQSDIKLRGHAIECRINLCGNNSENIVHSLSIPDSKNVEFHTYIHKNCRVPVFYDSMVGKLITYGKNRIEAIEKMKVALENIHIDGLATNLETHKSIFSNKNFIEYNYYTDFMIKQNQYAKRYLSAREKLNIIIESDTFIEFDKKMPSDNILNFIDYDSKIKKAKDVTGEDEAVIYGTAKIGKHDIVIFAMDANFMMGTMGRVVGEKITRAFELATRKKIPIIGITVSGGARMQEGIFSLMQMAKTSAAVKKHSDAELLYISIITNPTLGGVSASFASLADIIIAETDAIYGFSGRRIIEEALGKKLPKDFQSAKLCQKYGMVDIVADFKDIKNILQSILKIHDLKFEVIG